MFCRPEAIQRGRRHKRSSTGDYSSSDPPNALGVGVHSKGKNTLQNAGSMNDYSTSGLGLLERGGEGRGCGAKLGKWPYSNSAVFYFISRVSILKL